MKGSDGVTEMRCEMVMGQLRWAKVGRGERVKGGQSQDDCLPKFPPLELLHTPATPRTCCRPPGKACQA